MSSLSDTTSFEITIPPPFLLAWTIPPIDLTPPALQQTMQATLPLSTWTAYVTATQNITDMRTLSQRKSIRLLILGIFCTLASYSVGMFIFSDSRWIRFLFVTLGAACGSFTLGVAFYLYRKTSQQVTSDLNAANAILTDASPAITASLRSHDSSHPYATRRYILLEVSSPPSSPPRSSSDSSAYSTKSKSDYPPYNPKTPNPPKYDDIIV